MGLLDFLPFIGRILDKLIPDPKAKADAQMAFAKMAQDGEFKQLDIDLQMALAQAQINNTEAASNSMFKSGWRPAVGWICVGALAYQFGGLPFFTWAASIWHFPPPPAIDLAYIQSLLVPLLGLGVYRTVEKIKGVA